jgi:hypothetical protein
MGSGVRSWSTPGAPKGELPEARGRVVAMAASRESRPPTLGLVDRKTAAAGGVDRTDQAPALPSRLNVLRDRNAADLTLAVGPLHLPPPISKS